MAITVILPRSLAGDFPATVTIAPAPADIGALVAELERRHPGAAAACNSSSVNAAVNGDVILSGRDRTVLKDGDEVEFLVMFAGG